MDGRNLLAALALGALAACGGSDGIGRDAVTGTSGESAAITVTGCLQAGDPVGTYVLRSLGPASSDMASGERSRELGSAGEAVGTSGSGGTGGSSVGGRDAMMNTEQGTYRLIAGAGDDLGEYLGSRVSVKGEVANEYTDRDQEVDRREAPRRNKGEGDAGQGVGTEANRGSGGGRVQPGAGEQSTAGQFLRVKSIEKVSDTCSGRQE